MELRNRTRGTVLATRVHEARTLLSRLRGLLGRNGLGEGEGLLLSPCNSVHTFFMKFAIDVVFLAAGGRVVRGLGTLVPWRATRLHPSATCAIELPAGTLARSGTRDGDELELTAPV